MHVDSVDADWVTQVFLKAWVVLSYYNGLKERMREEEREWVLM